MQIDSIPYSAIPQAAVEQRSPNFSVLEHRQWELQPDLDLFFRRIYKYWHGKGFLANLLHEIFSLIGLLFVLLFSGFLLFAVNWSELRSECDKLDEDCDIAQRLLQHPVVSLQFSLWTVLKLLYLVLFVLYWLGTLSVGLSELRCTWRIQQFCKMKLGISEEQIKWISWPELVHRLVLVQRTTCLCLKRNLTEHDIINRILRKENYLVGMINKGVLNLNVPFPGFKKRHLLTKMIEWSLRWGIFNPMFDENFEIKLSYRLSPDFLSRRFRKLAVLNLLLAPFLLVFLIIYFLMMHVERLYHSPSTMAERSWSPYAKWRLREFNEMEHQLESRLAQSQEPAQDYVNQFPSHCLMHAGKLLSFILGSLVALLLCVALLDDSLLEADLTGHSLVWWAAILMIGLKLSRGLIPESPVLDPEQCMEDVVKHTRFCPRLWRTHPSSKEVQESFKNMFRYRVLNFLDEVMSVLLAPYILYFSLPQSSDLIVQFLQNYTVRIEGVGDVCSLATFDFERHGNKKYGSHFDGQKHDRSSQGKMEKSFLNFAASYPSWTPSTAGQHMLENLEPFLISSIYPERTIQNNNALDRSVRRRSAGQQRMIEMTTQSSSSSHQLSSLTYSTPSLPSRSSDMIRRSIQENTSQHRTHHTDSYRALELFYISNCEDIRSSRFQRTGTSQ